MQDINPEKLFELYKEMYYSELQRRESLDSSLNLPIGIVVLLAGGVFYYARNMPIPPRDAWAIAFIVILALASISLVVATIFLAGARWNHEYKYLPAISEIESYRLSLVEYYEQNPGVQPGVDEDFRNFFIERLSECTEQNALSNDTKSWRIHYGLFSVIVTILLLGLSALLFLKIAHA